MHCSFRQLCLLIASYAGLAIAWGWRLHATDAVPSREERLLDATRVEIVQRIAQAPTSVQQAAAFELATLPEESVLALQAWLKLVPEQRLRQLTVVQGPVHAPCALHAALLFAELSRTEAPPIDDTRLLISAAGDRLEEPLKIAALELLATQASENLAYPLALTIHQRICEFPSANWESVLKLVNAARTARRPAAALRVVNVWLERSPSKLNVTQREDALDLQTSLLLEGSRHAEASRITLDALRSLKLDEPVPSRLLQRALLATHAASESAELLPWLERHLRTFREHQLTPEALAAEKAVSPEYLHWLRESAAIADGQTLTSIACDGFFRLAAAGETQVLARLHALATQMGRGRELAQLFHQLERRLSVLELSRGLADGGATSAARTLLTTHLKATPNNRAGHRLLTEIEVVLRGESSAAVLWEGFLKRFPDDVPALRHLADLQIQNAQHPQALRTLQQIPDEELDEDSLRQMTALAIQLDDLPAAHHAQQLLVKTSSIPAIGDVLMLAELNRQQPATEGDSVLAESLAKLPEADKAFQTTLLPSPASGEATSFSTAAQPK